MSAEKQRHDPRALSGDLAKYILEVPTIPSLVFTAGKNAEALPFCPRRAGRGRRQILVLGRRRRCSIVVVHGRITIGDCGISYQKIEHEQCGGGPLRDGCFTILVRKIYKMRDGSANLITLQEIFQNHDCTLSDSPIVMQLSCCQGKHVEFLRNCLQNLLPK